MVVAWGPAVSTVPPSLAENIYFNTVKWTKEIYLLVPMIVENVYTGVVPIKIIWK